MTENLVSCVLISEVWLALGGRAPRKGRAPAFWRKTQDANVALDDKKGVWHDFARSEGGGILDLIQRVKGCDRRGATKWLKEYTGLPVDRPLSARDKRDYARRRAVGQREAEILLAWRNRLLTALLAYRDACLGAYHRARRYINKHSLDSPLGEFVAEVCELYEERYLDLDQRIDTILAAPWPILRDAYRRRGSAA
jgi:hypothetical protein